MGSWVVIYISDCTVYLPKTDFEAIQVAFWKRIQMYRMEIKIAMMFLEMARFWRRDVFLVLFHPLQMPRCRCSKVPGIHQEIEVKSCQTQQHTPHHTFFVSCIAVERYQKQS